ncbi:MAG TPA: zinc-binding alcohol dehydrogenase [Anaerolineales bacterium]|nr:zinc-binding alcohol dehydrogenase [Anaerolineales bacterium]
MERISLYFTAPGQVSVQKEQLPVLANNQLLVQALISAISPGTELLIYRGEFPADLPVDENIPSLQGEFRYPLRYGYATVGSVIEAGPGVDPAWMGRLVFAFQPHASHFVSTPAELIPVPGGLSLEEAVFLPNVETAVNFIMDGRPALGEHVAIFGQGIVGLLTTALLAQHPLASLVTLDRYTARRQASLESGASASFNPQAEDLLPRLRAIQAEGADLVYELSGSPTALDQAIQATGYAGRVVIGSWYGQKRASLDLGGHFHRSRIRLLSSQVSSLAPEFSGRWTKERRFSVAWKMIHLLKPSRWITHRFPLAQAEQAYRLLDERPGETLQVVFDYPGAATDTATGNSKVG